MDEVWTVPKTNIRYKIDPVDGPMVSDDGGNVWRYTFRGFEEFRKMWPTLVRLSGNVVNEPNEDAERELFGETLDEPIPDDLWEMIAS
jgi:hypothetical protein